MKRVFYGWYVCLGCALLLFCTSGLTINAFTIYQPYILKQNHFTNAQSSTIIMVRSLFSFISMFLTGAYYKKLSLRSGMTLAGLFTVGGFLLFGLAGSYMGYCLAAVVVGLGYGLGTMIPIAIILERWFVKKRTLAIGICSASTGLSTLGIPSLLTALIENHGLKFTFFAEAAFIALLVALSFLLVRSDPEQKGLAPYGQGEAGGTVRKSTNIGTLRKKNWLLLVPMLLLLGAMTSVGYSHLSVLADAEGFSPHITALAITVSGITMTVSKCIFGWVSDKLSTYKCNRIFGFVLILGMVLLCIPTDSSIFLLSAMSLYGVGLALTTVGLTAWAGDFSSHEEYDRTIRRFQIGYAAGTLVFSSLPGILADRFGGSYIPAYIFFALCAVFVVLSVQHTYRQISREGIKQ